MSTGTAPPDQASLPEPPGSESLLWRSVRAGLKSVVARFPDPFLSVPFKIIAGRAAACRKVPAGILLTSSGSLGLIGWGRRVCSPLNCIAVMGPELSRPLSLGVIRYFSDPGTWELSEPVLNGPVELWISPTPPLEIRLVVGEERCASLVLISGCILSSRGGLSMPAEAVGGPSDFFTEA